jgi:glycosyltransferase involved in cell wall biosynthesis
MRVCLFTPIFLPTLGGVGIVVHQLATFLTRRGHRVTVLTHRRKEKSNQLDLPYRVFRYSRPFSKRFGVEQMVFHLLWEKMTRGFNILHCHSAYPQGYVGALFKKIYNVPLVITSHGDLIKGERTREEERFARRAKEALELADAVTAVSYYMKGESMEAGASEDKIHLIPNGVDLTEFRSEEKFIFKTPYIFSMGILRKVKGFDILIRAFEEVKKFRPEVSLLIGGEGKEEGPLKKLVQEFKLGDRVYFLGPVFGREKVKLLKGCEFYVCSAIREEPFSNSILEAFASGKTAVASEVGGVPDLVKDGVNGLLVPPGNPDLLAKRMVELLDKPSLTQKLSADAQAISKQFDLEITMGRYLHLYEKLFNAF